MKIRFIVFAALGLSLLLSVLAPLSGRFSAEKLADAISRAEAADLKIKANPERQAILDRIFPPRNVTLPAIPPWNFPSFTGNPALEPLPESFNIVEQPAWFDGIPVTIRPYPRPGATDIRRSKNHADMYVFFYPDGTPVNQPPLVSAVPLNSFTGWSGNPEVLTEAAKAFNSNWELSIIIVPQSYVPGSIKSLTDLIREDLVLEEIQTNIFVGFPILPKQSTEPNLELNGLAVDTAIFEGKTVKFVDYDVGDVEFTGKPVYLFRTASGAFVGDPVLSVIPGQPHYNSIWEIFIVNVTAGYVANSLKSEDAVIASGFNIISGGEVFAPVVAVDGMRTRFLDFKTLITGPDGKFSKDLLPRTVPFPTQPWFSDPRLSQVTLGFTSTFNINEVEVPRLSPLLALVEEDDLILDALGVPLAGARLVLPPHMARQLLIINASGSFVHLKQSDVDNMPLNEIIVRGQAIFERNFLEEEGAGPKFNAYSCATCHGVPFTFGTSPTSGGGGIRFRNAMQPTQSSQKNSRNTPHVFGSGILTQLGKERHAGGQPVTDDNPHPHNWKGTVATLRDFAANAPNGEIGMQAVEKVAQLAGVSLASAAALDLDRDGFVSELTVGDITALTVFMASLPRPYQLNPSDPRVIKGRQVFTNTGCAACHTPVKTLQSTVLDITNPETASVTKVHLGDPAVELFSDIKRHKMGALLAEPGPQSGIPADVFRTQPLWGIADSAPYLHDGSANTLEEAIQKHGGTGSEALPAVQAYNALSAADKDALMGFLGSLKLPNRTQLAMDFINRLSSNDKALLAKVMESFVPVMAPGPLLHAWTFNPPPEGTGKISGKFKFQVSITAEAGLSKANVVIDDKLSLPLTYNRSSGFWETTLDTSALKDGDHKVVLDIQDSMGQKPLAINTSFITVQNTPPSLLVNLHTAGGGCSTNTSISSSLSLRALTK